MKTRIALVLFLVVFGLPTTSAQAVDCGAIKGGRHGSINSNKDDHELHHTPAAKTLENAQDENLQGIPSYRDGPAVNMPKAHHKKTPSHGSGEEPDAARATELTNIRLYGILYAFDEARDLWFSEVLADRDGPNPMAPFYDCYVIAYADARTYLVQWQARNPVDVPVGSGNAIFGAPAPKVLADSAQAVPGGIDFSSLELRYLADVDAGKGVRYALQAKVPTDGKSSGDGLKTAQTASDAFFVWLALPPASFTVNLNPNRPEDILDPRFARTDAGRILLEADLALKKTTAALLNPETELGKRIYDSLRYAEGAKRCVSARTWVEPGLATVRATESEVYILDAPLSVQRESAYLHKYEGQVASKTCPEQDPALELHNEGVLQTMLLPKIVEVVNQAPEFQDLRNVYVSRVAAQWVRDRNARTPTVYSDIIDSGNIDRWPARQPWDPMEVFNRYVKSFNEKEFRVEEKTVIDGGRAVMTTIRSYGGVNFVTIPQTEVDSETFTSRWKQLPETVSASLKETTRGADGQRLWLGGSRPLASVTQEPRQEPGAEELVEPGEQASSAGEDNSNRKGPLGFPAALGLFALIVIGWSLVIRRSVRSTSRHDPVSDYPRPQRKE